MKKKIVYITSLVLLAITSLISILGLIPNIIDKIIDIIRKICNAK